MFAQHCTAHDLKAGMWERDNVFRVDSELTELTGDSLDHTNAAKTSKDTRID